MSKEIETQAAFERSAAIFMAFVCAISLLALTGWLIDQPILASLRPDYISLAPSNALIFLGLCAAWLINRVFPTRLGLRLLVQAVLLGMLIIVIILALRFFTGLGPDLEQWLYPNPSMLGQFETAHMSPLSSLGFFLTILAFLLMTWHTPGKHLENTAASLFLVVFILSGINILGYLYAAPLFYGGTLIPVALTTALAFWFLGLGLIMTLGPSSWVARVFAGSALKPRLMRTFIPASILIVVIQGFLSSADNPWIVNPALKVALAAFVALLIVILIISLSAQKLGADFERGRQAEEALDAERLLLRTIIDHLPDGIYAKDINCRKTLANAVYIHNMGAALETEVLGKTDYDFYPPELAAIFYADDQSVIQSGQPILNREEMITSPDNTIKWKVTSKVPLRDRTGQVIGLVGLTHDNTERKQAEAALRLLANRQEAILASIPDLIVEVDNDKVITWTNTAGREFYGEAVIGKEAAFFFEGEQTTYVDVQPLFDGSDDLFYVESWQRRKDGRKRLLAWWCRVLKDPQGNVTGALSTAHDITERMQAEVALRASEAELRALFASMHDVVLMIDRAGVYRKIAPTNPEMLVKPPEQLLGKTLWDVFPSEQAETFLGVIQQVLATKQTQRIEYALTIRDQSVWFETSISQIAEDSTLWVAHDITDRKRNELVQNAIFRITQTAITSDGINSLYSSIHSILGELIPVENFFIALFDSVHGTISFPYYIDQYDQPPPAPIPLQGLTGYVIRSASPLSSPREVFDRLVHQGEVEPLGTPAEDWIGAPLKVEGRVIGVMAVQSYTPGIHFNPEDLNLLEFVSTQVAQAIERKRMEQEIRSLSLSDELTGLYNRRGFTLLAEQEMKLAHRIKRSMLLFFGDVDDLKTINDSLGHAQGDLVLKEISTILKETFREADVIARIGGDEFVVLAVDASVESTEIITNRIQVALEARNQKSHQPHQLTLSMGIARFDPEAPCTVSELISQADDLMYRQKQTRKGK